MKKIISGLLAGIMLTACAAGAEDMGFSVLEKTYRQGSNRIISPLSLRLALSLAAEGANGETKEAFEAFLGEEPVQVPDGVRCANAAFTAPLAPLKEDYAAAIRGKYGAEIFPVQDGFLQQVNDWCSEKTDGLIDSILDGEPDALTGLILANAIVLDEEWENEFSEDDTVEADFHAPSGTKTVDMMFADADFLYGEHDGVQIICLPYRNSTLCMWVILPEEGSTADVLSALSKEGTQWLQEGSDYTEVCLNLPKFDLTDSNALSGALGQLGLGAAFRDDADFSGISETPLKISEVLQKARVQVDEGGTKAAAVTAVIMDVAACPPEDEPPVKEMNVDRPFVFVIEDQATGEVCFAGAVDDPTA